MKNKFFNAHHSPIGSFASFTLGYKGAKGGLGIELGKPVDQNVYIGLEARDGNYYETLPFYEGANDESSRYDIQKDTNKELKNRLISFNSNDITRDFNLTSDTWNAKDLTFTIYSQVKSVPDPNKASIEEMKKVILPSVFVEMTIDNTLGHKNRKAFFGFQGKDPYSAMRRLEDVSDLIGIGEGRFSCIATSDERVKTASGFSIDKILEESNVLNWTFALGSTSLMMLEIPKGEKHTYQFVVCFYRDGFVTTGMDTKYYYTKFFKDIIDVANYACKHFGELVQSCKDSNHLTKQDYLSKEQQFLMNQSIRSYYGSTEFLIQGEKPIWIVNEGEYRMMNTFDLTVDQLFYEMKMNPWTVKNELDLFINRYSYQDLVRFPGNEQEYPGGISFTHDMGVANSFSRSGHSAYEMVGIDGCFSHMTHEQLVNFICTAAIYYEGTNDTEWIDKHIDLLIDCFNSMLNRDHPDEHQRDGIMSLDSSRVMGGAEITTYDSLDISLGQARNNIYLAGKSFSAYILLEKIFRERSLNDLAIHASLQAKRCADTLVKHVAKDGYIPAVLEHNNDSKIIPAIEGLVFLYFGHKDVYETNQRYKPYIDALKTHIKTILVSRVCLFDDSGWKLSSTSNNSWLSKIFLNQFITSKILGIDYDKASDAAHVNWLLHEDESYYCFSDQIISGVAKGSKYYPRGVTSILWLELK